MPKSMSWLNRSNSHSHSHSNSLSIPVIISEPTLVGDTHHTSPATSPVRYGPLGTGATIVRTAQDALRSPQENNNNNPGTVPDNSSDSSYDEPQSPLTSPSPCEPQPAFTPILLSPPPDVLLHLPTLMVTLDTSTSSLRTTYSTLASRPSHLADYLASIARSAQAREKRKFRDTLLEEDDEDEDDEEGESPETPFTSLFTAHLNSVGLVPQSAAVLHIFLDRPSAPYTHILSYLRSPTTSPSTLPRSASLNHRFTQERFEALLELRDEAKYLGLQELYQLCSNELQSNLRTPISALPLSRRAPPSIIIPPAKTTPVRDHHHHPRIMHHRHRSSGSSSGSPLLSTRSVSPSPARSHTSTRSIPQPRSAEGWI